MSGSLVEIFTGNLFDRLIAADRTGKRLDKEDDVVHHNSNDADELLISVIGPLLWSKLHFACDLPRPSPEDDGESGSDDDIPVNSNLSRKHEGTESYNDELDSSKRKRRKVAATKMSASQVCYELSKANVSPHLLIAPHVYGDSFGAGASAKQPFRVTVHPQVGFLSDFHGHLCGAEIIGLLAGKWDGESKILYVQASFPCTSTERREDDGSTDVELDPVAELAVREIISNLGLVVVGWYHSHPLFQPDPSVTDINNQQQYQTLMRDEKSGLEPFIGLIVSTYDVKLPSVESHHQWFHTRPYSDGTRGKKPVPIPMLLETNIGIYADMNQNINLFLENDQTDDLLSKLMNLTSNESAASNTVNNTNEMKCEEIVRDIKSEGRKNESNTNCNAGQTGTNDSYDDIGDDNDDVDNDNDEDNFEDDIDNNDEAIKYEINGNEKEDTVGAAEVYSDRILFSFHGAGGSEYLGQTDSHDNHQNIQEKISVGADVDNSKRKYKKKAVVIPDPNASERRSGRETKAPTLFIPEKEKKIALIPTILPINSQDSQTTQESVAIKHSKSSQSIKVPLKKSIKTSLQNDIVSKVPGRKKNIDKQIGSVDKWLKGGGEIIKEGPILSIRQGFLAKKAINDHPVSKDIVKTNQCGKGKGIQEVKSVENILESKKRHGPGARTSKSQQKVVGKLPSTMQEVEGSQPFSSSSSSSVVGGNKKKKFNTSTWLDDLERPATGTATASSSSSVVGGKRKKIPNTSMWLDELEKPNSSPKKKDSKNKKVTASKGSSKYLKQKINLSHIENIVNRDNQILSTALKSKMNSLDVPAMKKKKKGVICIKDLFCDETIMQKVCAHTHVACVEHEVISDDESISFLSLLQGHSDAAVRGRKLICSINPTHRCLVVGIVALGFYYSTHPRRMNLNLIWRDDILNIDKVKGSITYWASKLNVSFSCQKRIIDDISDFLIASWQEGDKKFTILPEKKEKKKRSNIDSVVSGPSHKTKDGTIIRYKEDDGKDDEPKKKKKKKIFRK